MSRLAVAALFGLALGQSIWAQQDEAPDVCAADSWYRPTDSKLLLACFDPEYVPSVAVVRVEKTATAVSMLLSGDAIAVSRKQAEDLTGASAPADGRLFLIRALASGANRRAFRVWDCGRGRVLVDHAVDRWRSPIVTRQPLVVFFRGEIAAVFTRCLWPH